MNLSRSAPTFLAVTTALLIAVTVSSVNAKLAKTNFVENLVESSSNPTCFINNFDIKKVDYLAQAETDDISKQLDTLFEKMKTNTRRREAEENAKAESICKNLNQNSKASINTRHGRQWEWCISKGYRMIEKNLPSSEK